MKPKTEEFLYLLLWTLDNFMHPTLRNLTESYESWAYRKGLLRQLEYLEERRLVEHRGPELSERLYQLTAPGRIHALGGRDPEERWNRSWDGIWRMIVFDVPCRRNQARERLRRRLRNRHFGCLQGSVWITPDPAEEECELVRQVTAQVQDLVILEAKPCAGETDMEMVRGAWDFDRIRDQYDSHRRRLERLPLDPLVTAAARRRLRQWARRERLSWLRVMRLDPLLPRALLPPEYPGIEVWNRRKEVLAEAGRLLSTFRPPG